MPKFNFSVRDQEGKLIKGSMDAPDNDTVVEKLMEKDYLVVSVEKDSENVWAIDLGAKFARIKSKDLVFLYLQFSNLINSGVSLLESLEVLEEQTTNPKIKPVLAEIRKDVLSGSSLSEAMAKHPKLFNRLFISLIRAGETGGMLDKILERIADFTEKEHKLKSKIRSAVAYPLVMFIVAISVVIFLLAFVFPRFVTIFKRIGANLPLPTQILIKASNYITHHYLFLIFIAVAILFTYKMINRSPKGNRIITRLKMASPLMGDLLVKASITRFCRTLGTLLDNGVPIIAAMDIVEGTLDNVILAEIVNNASQDVKEGTSLAKSLSSQKLFPVMIIKMIQVGEKTGMLSGMLIKSAQFYETEVEMTIDTVVSLLEPLMIVVMGALVGFIALAMFLPIFNMTRLVKTH